MLRNQHYFYLFTLQIWNEKKSKAQPSLAISYEPNPRRNIERLTLNQEQVFTKSFYKIL
jgi:hypothetical protein